MIEMENIKVLKEKYWAGKTSLAEERTLKEYFQTHPEVQGPEQSLFAFFDKESKVEYTREVRMPRPWLTKFTHSILPLAASFILLVGSLWGLDHYSKSSTQNEVIVDDPQMALQITREAFALLNGKVDQGGKTLKENIIYLDKTFIFKNL